MEEGPPKSSVCDPDMFRRQSTMPKKQEYKQIRGMLVQKPCNGHVWGRSFRPTPAVATDPPIFQYQCVNCNKQIVSEIRIPLQMRVPDCTHDLQKVDLGPNYEAYACTKCRYQKCKYIGI